MKKKLLFSCVSALLLLSPVFATAQSTSTDVGEGAEFCEKYAKKPLEKKNAYIVWVQGFFSAFNALEPKTKNIAGTRDYNYVRQWLDDYCKANPKIYFGEAVRVLIEELYPSRIPNNPDTAPKAWGGGEKITIQN